MLSICLPFLSGPTYVFIGLYVFNVSILTVFCLNGGTFIMLSALIETNSENEILLRSQNEKRSGEFGIYMR